MNSNKTHIKITAYKNTGKFYAEAVYESDENIQLFDEAKMAEAIRASGIPLLVDGFIVVQDMDDGQGFHNHLYRTNELQK